MDKLNYKKSFRELVEECISNNLSELTLNPTTFIGQGNPNANILLIGQEASKDGPIEEPDYGKAKWWKKNIDNDFLFLPTRPTKDIHHTATWQKYQRLYNYIFPYANHPIDVIDFDSYVFTTEMSEMPSKNTARAQKHKEFKPRLKERKEKFFKHPFFQQFPIVVLACGNYIINNENEREIDDIFGVKFHKGYIRTEDKEYIEVKSGENFRGVRYWFSVHKNEDGSKLVIHTRQLSGDIPNHFLKQIGEKIQDFMSSNFMNNICGKVNSIADGK